MDTAIELAFELLRAVARMLFAILERIPGMLRLLGRFLFELVFEFLGEAIADACARGWRRLYGWVAWITGDSWLAIPLAILLVLVMIAVAFVVIVTVVQALL